MTAMLTLPLEFAVEMLNEVLSENSRAWTGVDQQNKWSIARGTDEDTGMEVFVVIVEPTLLVPKS